MKRLIPLAAAAAALSIAGPAAAQTVVVTDPVGAFSGPYVAEDGSAAQQDGYARVSTDGGPEVIVCNGNPALAGTAYAYVSPTGSGPAAPNTAGNDYLGIDEFEQNGDPDGAETGAPCPR